MSRSRLVRTLRDHLERRGWPRVQLFVVVAFSGFMGFVVSYGLLSAGVGSMALRYGVAGLAGYLSFFALLWVWIVTRRGAGLELDAIDLVEGSDFVPRPSLTYFEGGRSGGAGAASGWDGSVGGSSVASSGGSWFDVDADDLGWVLVLIGAALAGALAIGYVIWVAPALLAEVLVDAAIVSTVSRHVASAERRDWTATALRRTWLPATVLILMLAAAGWALQKIAPDAKSIGPALHQLVD